MVNGILILGIVLGLMFCIYDQIVMDKIKGKTRLTIELKKQAGIDMWISIGLILLMVAQSIQVGIQPFTLFLLAITVVLCAYLAFFRTPRLLLKSNGFFFGNFFFEYQHIRQINLAQDQILVIDLANGRRLLVRIQHAQDVENVVNFFGGYK